VGPSRGFSNFDPEAEIWGTPGGPPGVKNGHKIFFKIFHFFGETGSYNVSYDGKKPF